MLDQFWIATSDAVYEIDLERRTATIVAKDPLNETRTLPEIKGEATSRLAICTTFSFIDPEVGDQFIDSGHISALFLDKVRAIKMCRQHPKRDWDPVWEVETRQTIDALRNDDRCVLCKSGIPTNYFSGIEGMVQELTRQG